MKITYSEADKLPERNFEISQILNPIGGVLYGFGMVSKFSTNLIKVYYFLELFTSREKTNNIDCTDQQRAKNNDKGNP